MKVRESGMPDEDRWASFFNPECILNALDVPETVGDVVEFGCGFGTFTIPAARMIKGMVFALDIEPDMVVETSRKAKADGLANVVATVRDFAAEGCGLQEGRAGYAMVFNLLHLDEPVDLLREAYRQLAPGGKLGVIHWRSDIETPRGPSMSIRPTSAQCRGWAEAAGFAFVREVSLTCCSWHWGLIMQKATGRVESEEAKKPVQGKKEK